MNYTQIIDKLISFGERQLRNENEAQVYIEEILRINNVSYILDTYTTYIPKYSEWGLVVDGIEIESLPCGLISGEINSADNLISSLISSQKNLHDPNINFNPRCEEISRSNHYFAPALAIARKDVDKIATAKVVRGYMEVEKTAHKSANILVGNTVNPKRIIVSHFDSIGPGAVDNASGIALSLQLILDKPVSLEQNLYILCGNEELSYDEGIYWGHGYREFETKRGELLENAEEIVILDSFGYSAIKQICDIAVMRLAFPIRTIEKYKDKMTLLSGGYDQLMEFYHAKNDLGKQIVHQYFMETYNVVLKKILK